MHSISYKEDFQPKLDKATAVLHALTHSGRLTILEYLGQEGPKNVGEISKKFDLDQSTISTNLRLLHRAGAVVRDCHNGYVFYSVNTEQLARIAKAVRGINGSRY